MNHTVVAAVLTGAVEARAAPAAIDRLRLPETDQTLADHAVCYPVSVPGTVLEPMYPDRLAEDFLALTFPGHDADYPAQAFASSTSTALLDGTDLPWTTRAITFLAAATDRWPHVGTTHLYPLIQARPQLLIDAGSVAMSALAGIEDMDMAVLAAVEPLLPEQGHADLDVGIAAVAARLTRHQLDTTTDPAVRSNLHARLATRLARVGRTEEAVAEYDEAIVDLRPLAGAGLLRHQFDLIQVLLNLGGDLATLKRWDRALAIAQEAERR
jgi:tetratricopeptide (TPR) repeat protein